MAALKGQIRNRTDEDSSDENLLRNGKITTIKVWITRYVETVTTPLFRRNSDKVTVRGKVTIKMTIKVTSKGG